MTMTMRPASTLVFIGFLRLTPLVSKTLGKVIPYGVYDEATNTGWVSVGVDHDTAEFAVETVRRWWRHMGSPHSIGLSGGQLSSDVEGSSALDFPLIHDARSQDPS